jgi:DNA-binding NarL/FixJ family response regulator
VADDARIVRRVLAELLASLDHTVVAEAASLQESVAATIRFEPDVAFIDVGLLYEEPQRALARIREACAATRVIVCAPLERTADVRRAFGAGANVAVVRPFRRSRLAEALARVR